MIKVTLIVLICKEDSSAQELAKAVGNATKASAQISMTQLVILFVIMGIGAGLGVSFAPALLNSL